MDNTFYARGDLAKFEEELIYLCLMLHVTKLIFLIEFINGKRSFSLQTEAVY